MNENAVYYGKADLYQKIRAVGGIWNDGKERPLVCLVESSEHPNLFWGIPMGDFEHRDQIAKNRIYKYLNCHPSELKSCFYHVGRTTKKSIFFISDVIPITKEYIEREYIGYGNLPFVIKNKPLIAELNRKLQRILSHENANPNYFRQNITDVKNKLIEELNK